ncbi:glycerophosphodiester phosphodiesterase family protein [Peristeroidobacter soli]|jgi:glycerophosphoryl diester phosphodiesterase|uniref:glycerophosphodiester phosphodiesterase family protein n=1 Tax=Peristeroidobacter soli TaxID=2497877 RepID=UPI00101E0694|nr:glycerophosphodiester phosphodiesterase family protein [Peristeroidobacter soli]
MPRSLQLAAPAALLAALCSFAALAGDYGRGDDYGDRHDDKGSRGTVQLGDRPFFLIDGLDDSRLKDKLQSCKAGPFYQSSFSIAHRGAPLQFPEHTKESYEAGARQGAGVVECDVTFTKDGELVCRHDECDLHTTTNIVDTDLNASCTVPWAPGVTPKCCASDITLAQFKTLKGKMDASNPSATTSKGYLGGTASFRTDLYNSRGTLLTLKESIALNKKLGVKHTPELKAGNPARLQTVFGGQEGYAQKMIDTFKAAGVNPKDVYAQSFDVRDVLYWIKNEPRFGQQAVYLDDVDPSSPGFPRLTVEELKQLKKQGVKIIAPPIGVLLAVNSNDEIVPSQYALDIKSFGFDIITWSFERADLRNGGVGAGFYYAFDPTGRALKKDSDMYKALDVLARKVGVIGIFSDWPATVTYYANCMGLK